VIVTAYLVVVQLRSHMAVLGGIAHMFAILMIGLGIMVFRVPAGTPLPPALESGWLVFHVFCAIVGSSTLTLAAAMSVVLLARARYEQAYGVVASGPERADEVVPDRVDDGVAERVPVRAAGPGAAYAAVEPADIRARFVTVGGYGDVRGRTLRLVIPLAALALFVIWQTPVLPMPREGVGAVLAIFVSVVAFCGLAWAGGVAFTVWLRDRLPAAAALDRSAYRVVMFGFPVWTLAIMAGAVWGEGAWGRWWGWDPKETWSFIVWVLFAGYMHARATHGWRGERAALLGAIGGVGLFINFYAVNTILIGLHSYAG
jgi:cytochrome c-type biogenesis protein CcsB